MQVLIERIEKDIAIVELPNGKLIEVPKELFGSAKENDVINIWIDKDKTDKRKQEIKDLMNQIFED